MVEGTAPVGRQQERVQVRAQEQQPAAAQVQGQLHVQPLYIVPVLSAVAAVVVPACGPAPVPGYASQLRRNAAAVVRRCCYRQPLRPLALV